MKLLATICFIILFEWLGTGLNSTINRKAEIQMATHIATDSLSFKKDIQPILVKKCSPCHFTGGKMYERLPFDRDTTILNHEEGLLRRIKGEESKLIKKFVAQKKAHTN